MKTTEPPNPQLPPFTASTEPKADADVPEAEADDPEADEVDVGVDQGVEEQVLSADTTPEGVSFMGDGFTSLDHYFRSELEEFIDPSIRWILDALDMRAVQARFEGRYRFVWEGGCVYRVEVPDPGPPGPWMPTRGVE